MRRAGNATVRAVIAAALTIAAVAGGTARAGAEDPAATVEYRLLATTRTSTMQKELNEAAEAGFRFGAFMGGETAFGGNEVVAVMTRKPGGAGRFAYRLLAASKTSTMQRELQAAADTGFTYKGQSIFQSLAGEEVVLILERDKDAEQRADEYLLLATSKTSTMQKELTEAGLAGYDLVGMTVARTAMGGSEVVAITRRPRAR